MQTDPLLGGVTFPSAPRKSLVLSAGISIVSAQPLPRSNAAADLGVSAHVIRLGAGVRFRLR